MVTQRQVDAAQMAAESEEFKIREDLIALKKKYADLREPISPVLTQLQTITEEIKALTNTLGSLRAAHAALFEEFKKQQAATLTTPASGLKALIDTLGSLGVAHGALHDELAKQQGTPPAATSSGSVAMQAEAGHFKA